MELRHDLRVDGAVTAGLAASLVTTLLVRDELQPGRCRWCDGRTIADTNGFDAWFRDALRRPDGGPASATSHVLAAAAPAASGGLLVAANIADRRAPAAIAADVVIAAQGTLVAVLLAEALQPGVVRPRPYAHAISDDDARRDALAEPGAMRSFPSAHTTLVFGAVGAAGAVASMRGYRLAPLVWGTGIMLGVATSYARIAADREYMTDTLAGAAIGLAAGAGVPLLFHPAVDGGESASLRLVRTARLSTSPLRGGGAASLAWTF